jgi:MFS family permease
MPEQLSKQAAALVAILYAVGLLIVDVNLGAYGVIFIELGRAQYLLVGSAWFLFSIAFPVASILWGRAASIWRRRIVAVVAFVVGLMPACRFRVMALGGWKTERMMRRYAAVTDATLRAAAEAVSGAETSVAWQRGVATTV